MFTRETLRDKDKILLNTISNNFKFSNKDWQTENKPSFHVMWILLEIRKPNVGGRNVE